MNTAVATGPTTLANPAASVASVATGRNRATGADAGEVDGGPSFADALDAAAAPHQGDSPRADRQAEPDGAGRQSQRTRRPAEAAPVHTAAETPAARARARPLAEDIAEDIAEGPLVGGAGEEALPPDLAALLAAQPAQAPALRVDGTGREAGDTDDGDGDEAEAASSSAAQDLATLPVCTPSLPVAALPANATPGSTALPDGRTMSPTSASATAAGIADAVQARPEVASTGAATLTGDGRMAAAAHPGEMKDIRPAASDTGTAHRLPEAAAARGRPTTPATSNAVALDAAAAAQGSPGDTVARSVAEATAAPATPPLSAAPPAPSAPQAAARPADLPPPFAALVADLEPPLHSPAFAPALGARLVAFVRDGIEQAELRLNPAELGPIAVRISLDGTQAQVDFHAAQAQTRHALHEALPALAGALRDSGLTLAGGGVFEQPRQPRGDARDTRDDRSRFGAGHAAAAPAAAPLAATRRARGVLDVFA